MKRILMAVGNHWLSPIRVGDHHLARKFAADGWQVGFISNPLSPFHFLGREREDYAQRLPLWRKGGRYYEEGRVWAHVPGALVVPRNLPPFDKPWLLRNWYRLSLPSLRRTLRRTGFNRVDVLYLRDVRFSFLLDVVEHERSVFRWADNDRGFAHFSRACDDELTQLAQRVTHLCYTARALGPEVARLGAARSEYLPNGVTLGDFERRDLDRPADLAHIPDPIALYIGSVDRWFDFELVREAATRLPRVSFVIVGPPRLAREKLGDLPNVFAIGRRPYDNIAAYLHHAAVGLIPFDVQGHGELVNAINPVKLYEYLAAGLPTVAVAWDELRRLNAPVTLASSADEFVCGIQRAIECPPATETLVRFASRFDWGAIYSQLQQFLAA